MGEESKIVVTALVVLLGVKVHRKIPTPFGTITVILGTVLTALYLYA